MACHTRGILITIITLISTPKTSFCPPPIALVPTAVPAYPLLRHALPLPSHHWRRLPLPFQPGDRPHSDLTQPHRDPNQHEAHSRPLLLSLTVKVCNRDFFSLTYDTLAVSVGYRGRQLGFVTGGGGGRIRARGSSYVDATLTIDGFEVIYDAFYLLEDIAKGVIPFDTDTRVEGKLGLFFFTVPLKVHFFSIPVVIF